MGDNPCELLREQEKDLNRALADMAFTVYENSTLQQRVNKILERIISIKWFSMERKGAVFLVNEDTSTAQLIAHSNLSDSLLTMCEKVAFGHCLCGRVAQTGERIFCDHVDAQHDNHPAGMRPHGHFVFPIKPKHSERVVGVLNLYVKEGHVQQKREVAFLRKATEVLAVLIEQHDIDRIIENNETNKRILDFLPHGVIVTDADGRPVMASAPLCDELHIEESYLLSLDSLDDLLGVEVSKEFSSTNARGIHDDKRRTIYCSFSFNDVQRELKISRLGIHNKQGALTGFIGIVEDVTEANQQQAKIEYEAMHDALTGLMNRMAFERKVRQLCRSTHASDMPHMIAFIDLDQFKVVNDACGHQAGDDLLRQLTAVYARLTRQTELFRLSGQASAVELEIARLGGDEFGLILYNCSEANAEKVAQRLVDEKKFVFNYEGATVLHWLQHWVGYGGCE